MLRTTFTAKGVNLPISQLATFYAVYHRGSCVTLNRIVCSKQKAQWLLAIIWWHPQKRTLEYCYAVRIIFMHQNC